MPSIASEPRLSTAPPAPVRSKAGQKESNGQVAPPATPWKMESDAPTCHECGTIMVRSGACHKCLNCGATSGCS
jgi:ribonucleoside-diphosphate reductase alpha chain